MIENYTCPEQIEWVPHYLFWQGKDNFVDLGDMSRTMRCVGAAQDKLAGDISRKGR